MSLRQFEPTTVWADKDGLLTERAKGYLRGLWDYIGATNGVVPVGSVGGDGTTTKFYRADGTFAVPAYPTGANPTGSIGTAAVNGTAATFLRSDAAPALNLGITPTWTGAHTFSSAPLLSAGAVVAKTSGIGIKVDTTTPTFGWRDIIGNVEPKATGVGSPTRASYRGGTLGAYYFVANDVCDFVFHIPHDYVPGTDIYFHIHWSHTGTSISGDAVFDVYHDYSKGHNQAEYPVEKNITYTYSTVDIATTPQYRQRIDEFALSAATATATLMDRDDLEVDGILRVTLKMTTLPTMGGSGKLFIDTCDIHYQSTNLATKGRAPGFYA